MAFECKDKQLHLLPGNAYLEVLRDGVPAKDGEAGELYGHQPAQPCHALCAIKQANAAFCAGRAAAPAAADGRCSSCWGRVGDSSCWPTERGCPPISSYGIGRAHQRADRQHHPAISGGATGIGQFTVRLSVHQSYIGWKDTIRELFWSIQSSRSWRMPTGGSRFSDALLPTSATASWPFYNELSKTGTGGGDVPMKIERPFVHLLRSPNGWYFLTSTAMKSSQPVRKSAGAGRSVKGEQGRRTSPQKWWRSFTYGRWATFPTSGSRPSAIQDRFPGAVSPNNMSTITLQLTQNCTSAAPTACIRTFQHGAACPLGQMHVLGDGQSRFGFSAGPLTGQRGSQRRFYGESPLGNGAAQAVGCYTPRKCLKERRFFFNMTTTALC